MCVILRFYLFRDLSFEQILFFISKWMFLCCTCFGPSHDCLDLNFHANWGDALFLAPPQLGPIRLFTLLLLKGSIEANERRLSLFLVPHPLSNDGEEISCFGVGFLIPP